MLHLPDSPLSLFHEDSANTVILCPFPHDSGELLTYVSFNNWTILPFSFDTNHPQTVPSPSACTHLYPQILDSTSTTPKLLLIALLLTFILGTCAH